LLGPERFSSDRVFSGPQNRGPEGASGKSVLIVSHVRVLLKKNSTEDIKLTKQRLEAAQDSQKD
jgi:hypothetical protein